MKLLPHDTVTLPLFKKAAPLMRACNVLLDIGSGIRPQNMVKCAKHICVEPHAEYADVLEQNGIQVIRETANAALDAAKDVDTIVALDVIEHMTRGEGEAFIAKALAVAKQQVIIFTPLGYMPQSGGGDKDPWGMRGQAWQKHQSGWTPEDFPGWKWLVDTAFHLRDGKTYGAFFAIHG